ncbi:uncharacterized protein LOC116778545 isoform X1 [Danaus plexippus]|uniref:uncharacterized protein LOC116778545 isoform X1 n=1 Tax=Danaus plexippus TaxID=13037 RepID=UPI002AB274FB|nr:uncharacterized protein LOC116778545 isoform X1 [Danaus plexippus]
MKQPPSVELKDNNFPAAINFGWSVGETAPAIGFYGDNSLFFEKVPANASDEIKAEYKISQDDAVVLPRQLSIPTAPPEEDNNSDESGLDVHSIEQDAKKDFPIYEEFVIEPSETDDDKIEYKEREKLSEDAPQDVDTFTNRVERFKQMETSTDVIDDGELQKAVKPITLATSTSPAVTIASYFDTGNYAVENHYKNSLTSPTAMAFNANITSTIPPGFEDEFNKNLAGIPSTEPAVEFKMGNIVHVPETSTQTSLSISKTFSQASSAPLNVVATEIETISSFDHDTTATKADRLPDFSSIIEPKREISDDIPSVFDNKTVETTPAANTLSESSNLFLCAENSANADVYSNFSRLSSYFSSPPQPDHSKSFFELSQSQNHYRHKPEHFDSIQSSVKNFFQSDSTKGPSIPQNTSQMNLVRDLASYKSFTPNDVVRTVNYFTVEYDIDTIKVGEPKSSIDLSENHIKTNYDYDQPNELGNTNGASLNIDDVIKNCKYCCDTIKRDLNCNYSKPKTCMDTSDSKKGDANMETKKDDIKKSVTINFCDPSYNDTNEGVVVSSENRSSSEYSPVKHHWFYRVDCEGKSIWRGFSVADSRALENAFMSPDLNENTVVATDGGRFDVNVVGRLRIPVYWSEKPTNVMRCSWFYKGNIDARYVPYAESVAEKLEEEYHHGVTTGEWHRRLMLPNNEMVVMHGPAVMVHFLQTSPTDSFGSTPLFTFGKRVYRNPPKIKVAGDQLNKIDHLIFLVHGAGEYRNQKEKIQSAMRPRVVRRGCVESEIEDTEPSSIDHLLLLCHGVGSACDMRFRSVEEVVDDFRTTSLQLIQSHYKNSYDSGLIGRVEVLPISWHSSLHSGETGVDRRLAAVTLESIPRLRNFTNDTILDVLFYTSPVYCQTIVDTVCSELNRIYELFKSRNPEFKGGVSLGGHSLGSVILYDLLCHQTAQELDISSSKQYVQGCAGTGQPTVKYPRLVFYPDALYALGSPIAIFECIRGVETLGKDFCLPTCKNFFNIFHPYDPIAYRLEPMINPSLRNVKPYLIPHHKGRKRMHLELKDTMARVGADIKQKLIESIRNTWTSMWRKEAGQAEVGQEEPEKEELTSDVKEEDDRYEATPEELGKLNGGRRVDHVLQEAPFEIFNEYLFAMTSHVCYWESEDTMLVMLREIYNALGVTPDCSLPQNTMTVERSRVTEAQDAKSDMSPEFPSTSRGSM